jgi:hypothetical protein
MGAEPSGVPLMKRYWIEYHHEWKHSPMTYWAYRCEDESRWHEAKVYQPPAPPPVAGKGFPLFHVKFDGVLFQFASLHELRVCIEVLSRRVLPTTAQLIRECGLKQFSNHVWLARLPAGTHSLRYRQKAVPYLNKALVAFEKEVPNQADSHFNTQPGRLHAK